MCAVALKRLPRSRPRAAVPGARAAPYPVFIVPCDPTLRERACAAQGERNGIELIGIGQGRKRFRSHAGERREEPARRNAKR
jgi:hypothetical protein